MRDLIKAIEIFLKYDFEGEWTHCEHDVLIVAIDPQKVSGADKKKLAGLSFFPSKEYDECFISFRFGSC